MSRGRVKRLVGAWTLSALVALPALAGSALLVSGEGTPMTWPSGTITYQVDPGPLGLLTNVEARALLADAFAEWGSIPRPLGVFADDMESGANGWTTAELIGSNAWSQTSARFKSPSTSWFVAAPVTDGDSLLIMPTLVGLPAGAEMSFRHFVNAEPGVDGGVLEYSTNGVDWLDAGGLITSGAGPPP